MVVCVTPGCYERATCPWYGASSFSNTLNPGKEVIYCRYTSNASLAATVKEAEPPEIVVDSNFSVPVIPQVTFANIWPPKLGLLP
jgi:hypothetical protein